MRQTPVNDYLEEISTELSEELYGNLSDAIYETVCEFDEEVAQLKADNAKLRKELSDVYTLHWNGLDCTECPWFDECDTMGGCPWLGILADHMRSLGIEVVK